MELAVTLNALCLVLMLLDVLVAPETPVFLGGWARPFFAVGVIMCWMKVCFAVLALLSDELRHTLVAIGSRHRIRSRNRI